MTIAVIGFGRRRTSKVCGLFAAMLLGILVSSPAVVAQTPNPPVYSVQSRPEPQPGQDLSARLALKAGDAIRDCPDCPQMIVIPAGAFDMGSGATPFDRPVRRVTIVQPYALSRSEITFDEWDRCVAAGGCKFRPDDRGWGRGDRPVINMSWYDAKDYIGWLTQKTGQSYRLPSEAEWEYAARGGASTLFSWGPQVGVRMANCRDCQSGAGMQTLKAGSFAPNPFGLVDMSGNVAEWVEDCWNDSYRGAPLDGSAWNSGTCTQRVLRGGSFDSPSAYVKPTARFRYDADVRYYANGFRIARKLQ